MEALQPTKRQATIWTGRAAALLRQTAATCSQNMLRWGGTLQDQVIWAAQCGMYVKEEVHGALTLWAEQEWQALVGSIVDARHQGGQVEATTSQGSSGRPASEGQGRASKDLKDVCMERDAGNISRLQATADMGPRHLPKTPGLAADRLEELGTRDILKPAAHVAFANASHSNVRFAAQAVRCPGCAQRPDRAPLPERADFAGYPNDQQADVGFSVGSAATRVPHDNDASKPAQNPNSWPRMAGLLRLAVAVLAAAGTIVATARVVCYLAMRDVAMSLNTASSTRLPAGASMPRPTHSGHSMVTVPTWLGASSPDSVAAGSTPSEHPERAASVAEGGLPGSARDEVVSLRTAVSEATPRSIQAPRPLQATCSTGVQSHKLLSSLLA